MKMILSVNELELLEKLSAKFLYVCEFDKDSRFLSFTGTQARDILLELFDFIPLLTNRQDQWILSNLGWRIVKNYF